jgi:hypothetical protein
VALHPKQCPKSAPSSKCYLARKLAALRFFLVTVWKIAEMSGSFSAMRLEGRESGCGRPVPP